MVLAKLMANANAMLDSRELIVVLLLKMSLQTTIKITNPRVTSGTLLLLALKLLLEDSL